MEAVKSHYRQNLSQDLLLEYLKISMWKIEASNCCVYYVKCQKFHLKHKFLVIYDNLEIKMRNKLSLIWFKNI